MVTSKLKTVPASANISQDRYRRATVRFIFQTDVYLFLSAAKPPNFKWLDFPKYI
ncbi:hypothetical protein Plhal304r1_c023g0078501 [Plasmopara halstedii]